MRISDWSSDVCSSDLAPAIDGGDHRQAAGRERGKAAVPLLRQRDDGGTASGAIAENGLQLHRHRRQVEPVAEVLAADRKGVVEGKGVSVRVDLGGRRLITKKNNKHKSTAQTTIRSN